jgi:hypothetical protein
MIFLFSLKYFIIIIQNGINVNMTITLVNIMELLKT